MASQGGGGVGVKRRNIEKNWKKDRILYRIEEGRE